MKIRQVSDSWEQSWSQQPPCDTIYLEDKNQLQQPKASEREKKKKKKKRKVVVINPYHLR